MVNRKQTLLDELKARIEASGITPELKSQAAQLVFGEGNPDADVLFIGEAPGKQEDLQGKPFVGASGKFLDEMLESIGMKREDIYITNIVKYRPPNNRDPLPEEKKAFLPYLQEQLEIIQPKIIVTLGRHSGGAFLPDLHISQDHGKPKRIRVKRQEIRDKNSQSGGTMARRKAVLTGRPTRRQAVGKTTHKPATAIGTMVPTATPA